MAVGSTTATNTTRTTEAHRTKETAKVQKVPKEPDTIPIVQQAPGTCPALDMKNIDPKLNTIDYKLNDLCIKSGTAKGKDKEALDAQIAALKKIKAATTLTRNGDKIDIKVNDNVTLADLKQAYNITDGAFIDNKLNGEKTGDPNGVNKDNQGSVNINRNKAVLKKGSSVSIPAFTLNPQGTIENTKAFIFGLRSRI